MDTYITTRYEQTGDQLFIRLESTNNPVYLEHFFTSDEQQDIEGTIVDLVAQLQILDDNYVAPIPTVSILDQAPVISMANVATRKNTLMAKVQSIQDAPVETTQLSPETTQKEPNLSNLSDNVT